MSRRQVRQIPKMTSFPGLASLYDENDDDEIQTVIRSPADMSLHFLADDDPEDDVPTCVTTAPSELIEQLAKRPAKPIPAAGPGARPSIDAEPLMTLTQLQAAHRIALSHERLARRSAQRKEREMRLNVDRREHQRRRTLITCLAVSLCVLAACLGVIGWQLAVRGVWS